jgi:hypothetical protein
MHHDRRGRLTLPFVVYILMAMAVLAALYPVFAEFYAQNVGSMTQGTRLIFQLVLPLGILVLLTLIYVKAGVG